MQFLGHSLKDGVGVEEESVPAGGIVIFFPHLFFLFLLKRRFLLVGVSIFLFYHLLELTLFASCNNLSNIFERRLYMDDSSEKDFVIAFSEGTEGLLGLLEG